MAQLLLGAPFTGSGTATPCPPHPQQERQRLRRKRVRWKDMWKLGLSLQEGVPCWAWGSVGEGNSLRNPAGADKGEASKVGTPRGSGRHSPALLAGAGPQGALLAATAPCHSSSPSGVILREAREAPGWSSSRPSSPAGAARCSSA